MRFAVAHKLATYLMVIFAYLAMVTGGALSGVVAFGGLTALIASWWWEPPRIRYEKWGWAWTVLSIFALVYSVLTAIVTGDFLGVGAQFLIWLIVAKAYNRRAARDWQQMYLLAFLMLVAGSVLNAELTYGLAFLGFVIASTWALTLFHLRREMEDNLLVKHAADRASERVEVRRILDSKRIVGGRFFVGTAALSFGVFLGAAIVFLALPRVGFGFFIKSRGGLSLAGFSDGVKLGGHGVIKNDATVVMRVEIDPKYGGLAAPAIHWRGVAFDHYGGGEWTRTRRAPETRQTLEWEHLDAQGRLAMRPRARRTLLWAGPALAVPEIEALAARTVKQEIWLDPLDTDVLFGASTPRVVEYPNLRRRRDRAMERNDEIRLAHGSTIHYTVYSELAPPPAEELRAARGPLPPGYEAYLQLPAAITERTRAKAREITAGLTNDYDKAVAIQQWLVANLAYTLELADPGRQEAVDFFLFDRKKGHCEYFASAFAVLARAVGIPVRQVNGFLGGEWNEYQGYVAVRAGDAHSWAEVYFPDGGTLEADPRTGQARPTGRWVTFDPTPPAGRSPALSRGGSGWRARLARFFDTLRFQWSKWVIEYDLSSQVALFKGIGSAVKSAATSVKAAIVDAKDWAVARWPYGAVLAAAAIGFVLVRRRRVLPIATAAPRRRSRARAPVSATYDHVAKLLGKHGLAREPSETPEEHARRIATRGHPVAPPLGRLTALYYAAEWGGRRDPSAEDAAATLAREIRSTLGRKRG